MSNVFYNDFKYDLSLPGAMPGPKYLFYPFNHEAYYKKPKLTNLNFLEKPQIYTRIDLSFPVDELNIKPELYNQDKSNPVVLTEEDEILFGDKKPRKTSLIPTPATLAPHKNSAKATPIEKPAGRPKETADQNGTKEQEEFDLNDPVLTKADITAQLTKTVNRSFEATNEVKITQHPTKKDVFAEEVLMLLPNFNDIDKR